MQTVPINMERQKARELWRKYKQHQHYSSPIDDEIRRAYQKIAQGRVVIKALESVVAAGCNDEGLPRLAIARADAETCRLVIRSDGSAQMTIRQRNWRRQNEASGVSFDFPVGSFEWKGRHSQTSAAIIPIIPAHLRPKRGLQNYHILWEAEWDKSVPVDPLLLRRIGKGDLWVVLAAWDLTEVERAALTARVAAH